VNLFQVQRREDGVLFQRAVPVPSCLTMGNPLVYLGLQNDLGVAVDALVKLLVGHWGIVQGNFM
jgi:hypothetical protein